MATANNTIKTRIQLKSDTEANWNKAGPKEGSNGFVPLAGELIVYTPDATHPFSRLKVGNGSTNIVDLPFIDAGTINGEEVEIVKREHKTDFPVPGSSDKLYIDLSTSKIYHFSSNGYTQLSNFEYTPVKKDVRVVSYWGPGRSTALEIKNNILTVTPGITPQLLTETVSVVTDLSKEGAE